MNNDDLLKKLGNLLDTKLDEKLEPIKAKLQEQGEAIQSLQKVLTTLKRYARRTNKTLDLVARVYNQEHVDLKKRVGRIEEHLRLPDLDKN